MTLRPRQLPKLREQLLRHLDNPASDLRSKTGESMQVGLDTLASHLRHAELYFVSDDMAALAMSSGAQLAAARWATADRPAPCGLIVFSGGIGSYDSNGVDIPVEACTWGPYQGHLAVWLLMSRRRLAGELRQRNAPLELVETAMPSLLPIIGEEVPVTAEPVPMADLEPTLQPVLAALAASWLLMQQPQLVDRTRERAEKAARRNAARSGLPEPDVTIVDLRRQYAPQDADTQEGVEEGHRYRHRWVVSGHWRNQPHGPDRALRRQQWIPAYVKGPDGAPLLATERVNVWRR